MRQLTDEQRKASQERRERFRALVKQVSDMTPEQRQALTEKVGAIVTCEGHALSPINTCLLIMQNPNVSMVGGFRQWLRQSRAVQKGQHGMMIWIPKESKKAEEPDDDATEGNKPTFLAGTVFDITQTAAIEQQKAA